MSTAPSPEGAAEQISESAQQFRLPIVREELVPRLTQAGLLDAIGVVREVFERERHARLPRRVDRLRRASRPSATSSRAPKKPRCSSR